MNHGVTKKHGEVKYNKALLRVLRDSVVNLSWNGKFHG